MASGHHVGGALPGPEDCQGCVMARLLRALVADIRVIVRPSRRTWAACVHSVPGDDLRATWSKVKEELHERRCHRG